MLERSNNLHRREGFVDVDDVGVGTIVCSDDKKQQRMMLDMCVYGVCGWWYEALSREYYHSATTPM